MGEGAVPSSSPIFFQSSPTKGNNNAGTPDDRMGDASSTVDDGDRTPRGNPGVRGMDSLSIAMLQSPPREQNLTFH